MNLENDVYNERYLQRKLVESFNCVEIYSKSYSKQKYKLPTKNNYIINNAENKQRTKKINLLKELMKIKFSTIIQKTINFQLLIISVKELIIFMLIINSITPIFSRISFGEYSFLNEITIKILGAGTQNILSEGFLYPPNEIYIENVSYVIDEQNRIKDLINYENNITMKWENKLTDCASMFSGLSNIIEIDLTFFDLSEVTSMSSMFQNCIKLEYIKLIIVLKIN